MKLPKGDVKTRLALVQQWERLRPVLIGLLVLAGVAVLGYFARDFWTERQQTAQQQNSQELLAKAVGVVERQVRDSLASIRAEIAQSDAARLVAAEDTQGMAALEAQLAATNSDLFAVRLLPASNWRYDRDPVLPITYPTLDMLEEAREKGELPAPDAVLFGSKQKHIVALAVLGPDAAAPVGYAVLGLRPDLVQSWLSSLKTDFKGYLRVVQPVTRGRPITLASLGQRLQGGAASQPVPGTHWRVEYLVGGEVAEPAADTSAVWMAAVGLVVLLLAGAGWFFSRRKIVAKSGPKLGGAAAAGMAGKAVDDMVKEYLEQPAAGVVPEDPRPDEDRTDVRSLDAHTQQTVQPEISEVSTSEVPDQVFRAYDIRGKAGTELSEDLVHAIGLAIGSEAYERGQQTLVVARDGRLSSPQLGDALIAGIRASGRDIIDVGLVPTPVLYFAASFLETESGVMVTGSHNPKEDNGFKIMLAGETLSEDAIQSIRERMMSGNLQTGDGSLQAMEVDADYIRHVSEDVPVALGNSFKVVIDCGNGVAAAMAPRLFRALGHDVVELFCELDGNFPNHHPDPSQPENMQALIAAVKDNEADIGFAFDGDGDRLGVVDNKGNIIWPDRLMMLFARDVLAKNPESTVVYDIKCSDKLGLVIRKLGGKPEMWRTGHSVIRARMMETGALLAGDLSGHLFFKDRWYGYDDAMYAGARLLEILQGIGGQPADIFARLPGAGATPELQVPMQADSNYGFMQRLKASNPDFEGGEVNDMDGLRVQYPDGWGLVRASNTTAILTLRFEAGTAEAMQRIQAVFKKVLLSVDDSLVLPF